ncbi:hypothetical protein SAMN05421847_0476 [Halpernia humi]|uniref:Uncharacterized protein n=1 Tax=Halpernia humi TaxID=493375 RepID=A0A1H5TJH4_9FLAO|nr:hypothetical protein [Halpernia humi]SEF62241.1 hypothetical protein SAMN05421847_0476 [Halpernia humi]
MRNSNYQNRNRSRNQRFGGNNYEQNNSYNFVQNEKKSGAVYSRIKKGKNEGGTSVNAWRKTKNGLMTANAFPVDGVEHASQDGKISMRYVVEVVNRDMGTTQTYWCLMSKDTKKIFIKELGLVISPNGSGVTRSGKRVTGFFGKVY